MARFGRSFLGWGGALVLALPFAVGPQSVARANALPVWDTVEEFVSPTTSLVSIPGGAGAGLATDAELAGAGISISGELAGVTAGGAIALTPVGWAIMAGAATAAGGYYAWQHRASILKGISYIWSHLSSSQQSALESSNTPGATVSLPTSAIQAYLGTLGDQLSSHSSASVSGYMAVTVPAGWPVGAPFQLSFAPSSAMPYNASVVVQEALPQSHTGYSSGPNVVYYTGGTQPDSISQQDCSSTNTSSSYCASVSGIGWYGSLGHWESSAITWSGVDAGQTVYWSASYQDCASSGCYFSTSSNANGLYSWSPAGSVATGIVTVSIPAVPNAASASVPPNEVTPAPSSSAPTFWPGSWSPSTGLGPAGVPAANPLVQPTPAAPYVAPTGLVAFIESLVVPTAAQVEADLAPLEDAFSNRIPFSYIAAFLALAPQWANGVGAGGCANFSVPEFGLANPLNPAGNAPAQAVSYCPGGFLQSAMTLLKAAFGVMLWAFLLGWGIAMFRRLVDD